MTPFFGSLSFLPLVAVAIFDFSDDDGDLDCSSMIVLILFKAFAIRSSPLCGHLFQIVFSSTLKAEFDLRCFFDHPVELFTDASDFCSTHIGLRRLSSHIFFFIINFYLAFPSLSPSRSFFRDPRTGGAEGSSSWPSYSSSSEDISTISGWSSYSWRWGSSASW